MGIEQTLVTRIAKRLRREPRWRLATLLGAACLLLAIGLAWAMTTLPSKLASEAVEVPRVVFPLEPTATLWRYDEQGALVRVNAKYSSLISFDQEFAGTGTIKTRIHFPEHQGSGGVYYGYRIRDDPEADTHFFSAIVINVDEDADLYRVEHVGYQVYDADKGYTAWIPTTLATATVPFVESAPAFFLTLEFDEGRFTSAKLGDHVCDWHRVADSTLWEVPGGAGLFCSSGEMTLSRPEVTTTRVNSGP